MRLGDHKIFTDKSKLYSLINLRINGYSYTSLAIIFACDISSIRAQCDKYSIVPLTDVYTIERITKDVLSLQHIPEDRWYEWNGKKFAKGKSYEEYLAQYQKV